MARDVVVSAYLRYIDCCSRVAERTVVSGVYPSTLAEWALWDVGDRSLGGGQDVLGLLCDVAGVSIGDDVVGTSGGSGRGGVARGNGSDVCSGCGGTDGGVRSRFSGHGVGSGSSLGGASEDVGVFVGSGGSEVKGGGAAGLGCVGESSVGAADVRGKNYARNQVWREKRKRTKLNRKAGWQSSDWRSPESVESSQGSGVSVGTCWTVKEESPMEKRIREALERKKAVEAELAAKKAELALARMNDKTMTDLYNDRVKQEAISRMNQATQRSVKSLEQLRSVSPGSSATPGEIREALLYSEEWKVKEGKIRAWIAKGDLEGARAVLDEGRNVEAETLNTEERGLMAEWPLCEIVEEERVESSDLEKANVAAALLWSQKRYIAFVARRCRDVGEDPESGLLGPEIGVYRGMTAAEFAEFDAL